jgi:hypothetical protein
VRNSEINLRRLSIKQKTYIECWAKIAIFIRRLDNFISTDTTTFISSVSTIGLMRRFVGGVGMAIICDYRRGINWTTPSWSGRNKVPAYQERYEEA